ncbi:hypothetical protein CCS01_07245 [Rhodopila globiformis]|uniref:TssC1 N-terminal domain-containing protein n=1 Tax=Rhodopila globiformis TaxID=1071 RepID=A0A2S6NKB6_RHOGL|nr:type VI secretion system contractile sheath large subunit [Rhodopila globiformis]PPQ35468.1 hypothetical protein CCS01_07245 [Rhodopila globiformis]
MSETASTLVVAPAGTTEPPAAAVRTGVLAGKFVGRNDPALAEAFAAFLNSNDAAAVEQWFGTDRAAALLRDPHALRGALDRDIAAIDAMLSEQVDAILHHPRLMKLEGSWRGLAWLVGGADLSTRLKIKVLNAAWPVICRDLEIASEFDQSQLFRKIYEQEFGSPGGEPYGFLMVDQEMRHRPDATARTDDLGALAALSGVVAAAFAPVLVGAAPALLEVDTFQDLANALDVTAPLRNADHARWRGLAARADMRFVGVALPRMLARPPWQDDGSRADGFHYTEYAPTAEQRVWCSAAYARRRDPARPAGLADALCQRQRLGHRRQPRAVPAGGRARGCAGNPRQARQFRLHRPAAAALSTRRRISNVPARDGFGRAMNQRGEAV